MRTPFCPSICPPVAAKRPPKRVKLTITIDEDDLELLRKRARRVAGGNVSTAIVDALHMTAWLVEGDDAPTRAHRVA